MNSFFARAANTFRQAFTADAATTRYLEETYVRAALSSSFGGG